MRLCSLLGTQEPVGAEIKYEPMSITVTRKDKLKTLLVLFRQALVIKC